MKSSKPCAKARKKNRTRLNGTPPNCAAKRNKRSIKPGCWTSPMMRFSFAPRMTEFRTGMKVQNDFTVGKKKKPWAGQHMNYYIQNSLFPCQKFKRRSAGRE